MITIMWLKETLHYTQWKDVVVAYDNNIMCQLDSLKAARNDLPLEAPFDKMWKSITKIIDHDLHIQNHSDPNVCKCTILTKSNNNAHIII